MIIQTRLSEKEFVNASIATLWGRKYSKVMLGVVMIIAMFNLYNNMPRDGALIPTVLPVVLIFSLMIFLFRYGIKKAYRKNYRASENIEYNFEDTQLLITGESFTSAMTWNKVYKVTKTKNWLLVWHSSQVANAIPMRQLLPEDLAALKLILANNNTKNNL